MSERMTPFHYSYKIIQVSYTQLDDVCSQWKDKAILRSTLYPQVCVMCFLPLSFIPLFSCCCYHVVHDLLLLSSKLLFVCLFIATWQPSLLYYVMSSRSTLFTYTEKNRTHTLETISQELLMNFYARFACKFHKN